MVILQATEDLRKVSLWLGHADMQTREVYLRADPTEKIEALESIMPPALRRGQFTVPDKLIASLRGELLRKDWGFGGLYLGLQSCSALHNNECAIRHEDSMCCPHVETPAL